MIRFIILMMLPLASAIMIGPNAHHTIGPLCDGRSAIWNSTLSSNGTFSLYHLAKNGSTTYSIATGTTMFDAIIPCDGMDRHSLAIVNRNGHHIDVTYYIDDITPGTNLFMIMFIIMTPLLMATTVIAGLSCLVAGLCVSKFMVGDTYVSGPIDSGLTEEMMNRETPVII